MRKLLASALVLVLVMTAFAACQKNSGDESGAPSEVSGSSKAPSEASSETSADPYAHLRNIDLDQRIIKFLVYDDSRDRYKSAEIAEHGENAEVVNDAIVTRNETVETLLNCIMQEVRVADVLSAARNDILAEGEYDIIMPYTPEAATLAQEGYLIDLKEFSELIQLDRPYWDQRANQDLSIANKLYFSTGDFSLLTFDCTHAIVFNKTLVDTVTGVEDPYKLLSDGEWTFDALHRNAKLVTAEIDGEEGMTFRDRWGIFLNEVYATTLFIGAGERLTSKDTDDYPVISVDTASASSVIEKIRDIFNDRTSTIIIEGYQTSLAGAYPDVYYAATAATAENRALFRTMSIVDLKELADFDCSYGILPTPKFDSNQDEYYNIVSAILASCLCIHNNVRDPDASAAVAEALAAASTNTVRKAYYEFVLKGRQIPDEKGEEALDIIFNNRVYEAATIYNFGALATLITTCATAPSDIFSSTFESMKPNAEAQIDKVIEAYENND